MGKALGSWSGMRRYLEQEMIADDLRGRVRYNCTSYVGMDGCRIFELFLDGKLFKQFSWETQNSYFIRERGENKDGPGSIAAYWDGFWEEREKRPLSSVTEYTDGDFCDALETYRNQDILSSIVSDNPIVRMFALFDRRVGKRTLKKIGEEMKTQPGWLRQIYEFRCRARDNDPAPAPK